MFFPFKNYRKVATNEAGVGDTVIEVVPVRSMIVVEWFSRTGEAPVDNAFVYCNNASNFPSTPTVRVQISRYDSTSSSIEPDVTTGDMIVPAGNTIRLVTAGRMNVRLHIFELPENV